MYFLCLFNICFCIFSCWSGVLCLMMSLVHCDGLQSGPSPDREAVDQKSPRNAGPEMGIRLRSHVVPSTGFSCRVILAGPSALLKNRTSHGFDDEMIFLCSEWRYNSLSVSVNMVRSCASLHHKHIGLEELLRFVPQETFSSKSNFLSLAPAHSLIGDISALMSV